MASTGDRRRSAIDALATPGTGGNGSQGARQDEPPRQANPLDQWLPATLQTSRWIGWRMRALVAVALLGCVGLFALTALLATQPHLDATWRIGSHGELELVGAGSEELKPFIGKSLREISGNGETAQLDALALLRSPRWLPNDSERQRHAKLQRDLAGIWPAASVTLYFGDAGGVEVRPEPQGALGLGPTYWLLSVFALALLLMSTLVLMIRPSVLSALYAVMGISQCGNLLFIAVSTVSELNLPVHYAAWEPHARMGFDLATAAALLHTACRNPRPLPWGRAIAVAGWSTAVGLTVLDIASALPHAWWWTQAAGGSLGLLAIAMLGWSYRIEPHPYALVMRRFGIVTVGTWLLLTAAIAAARHDPGTLQTIGTAGSMTWVFFLSSLLLLVPFLAKSHQLLREFSLLAGISTVATSLDLLFVTAFSLGQFTSLTLSVFLSLGLYAGVRQWMLNHLRGANLVTMERLFERLYRMARDVESHPENAAPMLMSLLRDLFEPLDATVVSTRGANLDATASGDGSTLTVPVPNLRRSSSRSEETVVLRYSQSGRRLFTEEDARVASRIVDQIKRAVVFDQAVERGRSEERSRLAQDLHDDIGARLLTLMYQAQSPEQEDYIRHTLQDLKTLTRGLAAHSHRLSHALVEWKADMQQRLELADVTLDWESNLDRDAELSVTQWSALTRVLRELISNTIAHARATRVTVTVSLLQDRLDLCVADDGVGTDPQAWAHGLGLGGIRKRVKLLGGEVSWSRLSPSGIECRVRFSAWSQSQDN